MGSGHSGTARRAAAATSPQAWLQSGRWLPSIGSGRRSPCRCEACGGQTVEAPPDCHAANGYCWRCSRCWIAPGKLPGCLNRKRRARVGRRGAARFALQGKAPAAESAGDCELFRSSWVNPRQCRPAAPLRRSAAARPEPLPLWVQPLGEVRERCQEQRDEATAGIKAANRTQAPPLNLAWFGTASWRGTCARMAALQSSESALGGQGARWRWA